MTKNTRAKCLTTCFGCCSVAQAIVVLSVISILTNLAILIAALTFLVGLALGLSIGTALFGILSSVMVMANVCYYRSAWGAILASMFSVLSFAALFLNFGLSVSYVSFEKEFNEQLWCAITGISLVLHSIFCFYLYPMIFQLDTIYDEGKTGWETNSCKEIF